MEFLQYFLPTPSKRSWADRLGKLSWQGENKKDRQHVRTTLHLRSTCSTSFHSVLPPQLIRWKQLTTFHKQQIVLHLCMPCLLVDHSLDKPCGIFGSPRLQACVYVVCMWCVKDCWEFGQRRDTHLRFTFRLSTMKVNQECTTFHSVLSQNVNREGRGKGGHWDPPLLPPQKLWCHNCLNSHSRVPQEFITCYKLLVYTTQ